MASEQEYPKERAALLADWRQRLKNQQEADHALFMHVNDLEPGVLVIEQLQQQLAQTREELRIALAQRQDYRAALAQAREEQEKQRKYAESLLAAAYERENQVRALLEEFIGDESDGSAWSFSYDGPECVFCAAYDHQHAADCPMVKARAFLGKEA